MKNLWFLLVRKSKIWLSEPWFVSTFIMEGSATFHLNKIERVVKMKIKCVPIQVQSPLKSIHRLLGESRPQFKSSSIEFYLSWYTHQFTTNTKLVFSNCIMIINFKKMNLIYISLMIQNSLQNLSIPRSVIVLLTCRLEESLLMKLQWNCNENATNYARVWNGILIAPRVLRKKK